LTNNTGCSAELPACGSNSAHHGGFHSAMQVSASSSFIPWTIHKPEPDHRQSSGTHNMILYHAKRCLLDSVWQEVERAVYSAVTAALLPQYLLSTLETKLLASRNEGMNKCSHWHQHSSAHRKQILSTVGTQCCTLTYTVCQPGRQRRAWQMHSKVANPFSIMILLHKCSSILVHTSDTTI
jgi:hypothetical protein